MNLFNYLEKHGELENATAALEYFADIQKKYRKSVDVNDSIFKCYKIVKGTTNSRSGQISFKKFQVELHEELMVVGREGAHKQTLLHETAHLIVQTIWGHSRNVKSHGREWKMVMYKLGAPAERCSNHQFLHDRQEKQAKLIYACMSCGYEIAAQKPRKMANKHHPPCKYHTEGGKFYLKEDRRIGQINTAQTAPELKVTTKPVLGQVSIKKALYRNRWLKPGTYNVVREFKYKKNDIFRGTITILIGANQYRVTVKDSPEWFVR